MCHHSILAHCLGWGDSGGVAGFEGYRQALLPQGRKHSLGSGLPALRSSEGSSPVTCVIHYCVPQEHIRLKAEA